MKVMIIHTTLFLLKIRDITFVVPCACADIRPLEAILIEYF